MRLSLSFPSCFPLFSSRMRILICPDKFKGSLTAKEVCEAIDRGVRKFDPLIETRLLPLADGGEGTLDILESHYQTERIEISVFDPLYRIIDTYYLKSGRKAFIEMAKASGLELLKLDERNPMKTSTYGTGQMIRHAIESGCTEIFLSIGGSATNDGGIGMAEALGYKFFGKYGIMNHVRGDALSYIEEVRNEESISMDQLNVTVLSDVKNPLLGPNGATNIYGRQKGATQDMIFDLDDGLKWLTKVLKNGFEGVPGSGAAGGLGYGAMSFLGARIESGIQSVLALVDFETKLSEVNFVVTGEGKLDSQSMEGKVISGVIDICKNKNIPIGIICGYKETDIHQLGVKYLAEVMTLAKNTDDAIAHAGRYVEELAFDMIRHSK